MKSVKSREVASENELIKRVSLTLFTRALYRSSCETAMQSQLSVTIE
jgi:hypothetical protein